MIEMRIFHPSNFEPRLALGPGLTKTATAYRTPAFAVAAWPRAYRDVRLLAARKKPSP